MTTNIESIMVINAGSSSLKFKLFKKASLEEIASGLISSIGTSSPKIKIKNSNNEILQDETLSGSLSRVEIVKLLLQNINKLFPELTIVAAGHRILHGANKFIKPTIINAEVIAFLKSIIGLSPLHLPHNINPMEILQEQFPDIIQIGCFDTAFHATNPDYTRYYSIPRELIEKDHIMRYGFHGLSYEYITSKLQEIDEKSYRGKVVICHLGSGVSLAAVKEGVGFTTTMGFTPLEGTTMATRAGNIDAGILLYLMNNKNYTAKDLENLLYFKCGILGLSGESSDFQTVVNSSNKNSQEAIKIFVYSIVKEIGAMVAAIDGVDTIIFTAGIGENDHKTRAAIVKSLSYLGLKLNEDANKNNNLVISTEDSQVKLMVIPTQEELMIARHCSELLN